MNNSLCPLQLRILLCCYVSPNGPLEIKDSIAKEDYIADLMARGVIRRSGNTWGVTEKGEAWLNAILSVPEPVQVWVIPE